MRQATLIFAILAMAFIPGIVSADYVFSAPPRETPEKAEAQYAPIAEFLTRATGERFVYEHPASWPTYAKKMKTGEYALVFDGPHFVSWRISNIEHVAIVKLPQPHEWVVMVQADQDKYNTLEDLEAHRVCGPASPNFGTLTLLSHFNNPVREPVHVITKGWRDGFNAVMAGRCVATVLPRTNLTLFDPEGVRARVIHRHDPYPNQAFTAGPEMDIGLRTRVQEALLSPEGQQATAALRQRFAGGRDLVRAGDPEYTGVDHVLERAVGFGIFAY